ncbi:MAG: DUF2087 domain-containing protein [Ilumatobacteraceae bacterium]
MGLDAAGIIGLLADDDRRRCFAALELGATTRDQVAHATGLTTTAAAKALGRLVSGGLVVGGDDGGLFVLGAAFSTAARAALAKPDTGEFDDLDEVSRKVMRAFVTDGRITQIPVAAGKRRILLDWMAQNFDIGRRYSEAMVNLILGRFHPDTAALRRHMVDEGVLDRDAGQYWRSGGTVEP